jgi:lambda family phage tail tape measure protein
MAVGELLGQLGSWAVKSIPGIGALAVAFVTLIGWIKDAYEWSGKLTGLWGQQAAAAEDASKKQSDAEKAKAQAARDAARDVEDAFKKQILAIRGSSDAFDKQNKKIIDQVNLENSLIGATKGVIDITKAQEEIFARAGEEADKLREAKSKLTDAEKRRGLGDEYDRQIVKVQELAEADSKRVATVIGNTQRLEAMDNLRKFGIQNQIEKSKELQGIQDSIAKSTLSELEKKYYDIEAAAKASAKAAIEAEEARRGGGTKLSAAEQQQYYDAAIKGSQQLKDAAKEEYQQSRDFNTGWKQAFNEYAENATNAANAARSIFQKTTQGMEDMIVNFAKTGKFEWKNFVSSMMEELLRSQLKATMNNLFSLGGSSSGGGFLSGLGSLLGFANGGVIPTNGPVIVGERGPELLSGAAGRTVTPNNQLGGGSVTYNINAVDSASFKQMIARDPSFIHAVAMQGGKGIPGRYS